MQYGTLRWNNRLRRNSKSHIKACKDNNIKVVAVTDVNKEAAEKTAKELGSISFADSETMLKSDKVNIVSTCTSSCAHEREAVMELKLGVNILLEKPQAHSLNAAKNITKAAEKSKAKLMMTFRHRFIDANCKIKEIMDSGKIGASVFFENIFCGPAFYMKDKWFSKKEIAGGGSILDTSSHSADIFRYFFGEITEWHGVSSRHLPRTDLEDAGMVVVKSSGGVTGTLISTWVDGIGIAKLMVMVMGEMNVCKYCHAEQGSHKNL
jgi:predicted dehydrogenase